MAFIIALLRHQNLEKEKLLWKKHADYINREGDYKNFDNKQKIAASHAEYINRQNDFLKKILLNDMVDVYIKLINFLNGQMAVLLTFEASDLYGRANGLSYREFELALQEELTLEQKYRNCKYYTK